MVINKELEVAMSEALNTRKLNDYDQKIRQTLARDVLNNWTAVSTLLVLISSVYHVLFSWRSNQRLQNAEPILSHWAIDEHRTQAMPN